MRSLSLVPVGFLLSATWSILEYHVSDGRSIMICLAACACCLTRRINSLPLLALAAALGLLLIGACPASSVVLSLERGNRCGLVSPLVRNNVGRHVACERLGRMSDS
jgi:hypothetical protein